MDRDDAIRKIKRCLELGKSDNPTEAASALRQAQKLSEAMGIEQLDLQLSDVSEARSRASSAKVLFWEGVLAGHVADAFGCELFTSKRWASETGHLLDSKYVSDFVFIGLAPAHELASYAFDVLQRQCRAARRTYVKRQSKNCKDSTKKARGDAFAIGWVRQAVELLGPLATAARNKPLLDTYMQRNHPNLSQAKLQRRDTKARPDDYRNGAAAGSQAQLHGGVGKREAPRLLAGGV
jgi:hypothetical protein